jgi:MerR family transcriptional regulator, copper efflux regulator
VENTVKQVADRVGLPSRTVRYYDSIGLVSPGERSPAGYRLYGPEDVGKLQFVRQAKGLGFSLAEIRGLIAAAEEGCCDGVMPELERLLDAKVGEIDDTIAELKAFRSRLVAYRAGTGSGCGCTGHGAFCECLGEAPLLQIQPGGNDG